MNKYWLASIIDIICNYYNHVSSQIFMKWSLRKLRSSHMLKYRWMYWQLSMAVFHTFLRSLTAWRERKKETEGEIIVWLDKKQRAFRNAYILFWAPFLWVESNWYTSQNFSVEINVAYLSFGPWITVGMTLSTVSQRICPCSPSGPWMDYQSFMYFDYLISIYVSYLLLSTACMDAILFFVLNIEIEFNGLCSRHTELYEGKPNELFIFWKSIY